MKTSLFKTLLGCYQSNTIFEFDEFMYRPVEWLMMTNNRIVVACQDRMLNLFVFKVIKFADEQEKVDGETKTELMDIINGLDFFNILTAGIHQLENEVVAITTYRGLDLGRLRAEKIGKGEKIAVSLVLKILLQVTAALKRLHENDLIHRDVKLGNIFMDNNSNSDLVVLGDYGVATKINHIQDFELYSSVGSVGYLPPELEVENHASFKWDVWSLAITILKFMFGDEQCDFTKHYHLLEFNNNNSEKKFITTVHRVEKLFEQSTHCLKDSPLWKDVKNVLLRMLLREHERPNVKQLFNEFFVGKGLVIDYVFHKLKTISSKSNEELLLNLRKVLSFKESEAFEKGLSFTQFWFILDVLIKNPKFGGTYVHKPFEPQFTTVTPIFYKQMDGEWKWSPDGDYWMSCSTETVIGGYYDGQMPVMENIRLLKWLHNDYGVAIVDLGLE
ncbi:hypothetical protein NAEGRDRAFT_79827 [Naegleria gruberi]|uniref:Protein kinase domain-containing protein n=1 Tax=Naegleria gruberi TaxID=5762 RepID=D2VFY2_NAEGR|nr:uncharacterized protein NAEGRDRAFT_79827 [Naegleria gruberi]EFC44160.1 hypothetical protein NAEGRDRAFT_79827 [Naegleria gruberi]|eukprot:XP_002676904.1 hypothetical protein NAEGRDRAFT_79827 [Naegleria gruberi strain NEG-M]